MKSIITAILLTTTLMVSCSKEKVPIPPTPAPYVAPYTPPVYYPVLTPQPGGGQGGGG